MVAKTQNELHQEHIDTLSRVSGVFEMQNELNETSRRQMLEGFEGKKDQMQGQVDSFVEDAEGTLKYLHVHDPIDLRGDKFDPNLFYPVLIRINAGWSNRFEIFKVYSSGNGVDSNGHSLGLAGLALTVEASGGTWGGNPMDINIIKNVQTYRRLVAAVGLMGSGYYLGVYLKGGHHYKFRSSNASQAVAIYSEHKANYVARTNQYKLDCGPIDAATGSESAGAIATVSHWLNMGSAGIHALGGINAGYYK